MDIKIISQNISNNPEFFTPDKIEKFFEEYGKYILKTIDNETLERIVRTRKLKKIIINK